MKTKYFFSNSAKTAIAIVTTVVTMMGMTAWAGQDAGKKNGSAIGSEDGDGHRGSLKLGDNMKVWAGQNPSDADKHLFPFETRVPACFFRPYARIVVSK